MSNNAYLFGMVVCFMLAFLMMLFTYFMLGYRMKVLGNREKVNRTTELALVMSILYVVLSMVVFTFLASDRNLKTTNGVLVIKYDDEVKK